MSTIKENRDQLEQLINTLTNCYTSTNETGFTLNNNYGVKWGITSRKKKWGQAFEEQNRFICAIDFLVGAYEVEELSERIGLPIRNEGEEVSGIRKRSCPDFDTVQISLYKDSLASNYSFNNQPFLGWLREVAKDNQR